MSDPCTEKARIAATEEKINKLCKFQGETESSMKTIFNFMDNINKNLNRLMFTIYGSIAISVIAGVGTLVFKSITGK